MTSTTFVDLRINNAEQLKESVSEPSPNTKIYLIFGKTDAWPNVASPNVSNSSVATYYEVWNNMIGGKRLFGSDLAHVIPRFTWTANTVYTEYDHMATNLYDGNTEFYVITSDNNVYKCLSNNDDGQSTVEPTSLSTTAVSSTSDGYIWKYMYTVSDAELMRFTSDNYIPVKTLSADDGSLQWQVQDNAISGSIEHIVVANGGINYTNTSNILLTATGDGTSLTATVTINTQSNSVNTITVTNAGSDYSYAILTISGGGGSGAEARAVISPPGGHGSNPLYELGGKNIMINARLKYDENGILPETNNFGQIGILKDPIVRAGSNVATLSAFLQCYSITAVGAGNYTEDEMVYQGTSLATSFFKGKVLSWNSITSTLLLINTVGTPLASQLLIGSSSSTARVISSVLTGELQPYSGKLLYVDNIKSITRASDQVEDFKILIKY